MRPIYSLIVLALMLFAAPAMAQCPNGRCLRPAKLLSTPTLAPTRHQPRVIDRVEERSVVVRRGYSRGPGLFARATFRPQRLFR